MPTWTATIYEDKGLGIRGWGLGRRGSTDTCREKQNSFSLTPNPQSLPPCLGFTLLELSLVLFIIGLLVTVLVPRLGDLSGSRLEASARRLASLARYLNGEAAFHGQLYRLNYDLDKRAYWVSVLASQQNTPEFIVETSLLARPVQLPPSITFADVHVLSGSRVSTGQVYTHFYPQGYTDPTTIHLRDQYSRVMTVTIPPLPAEVGVAEGYVDGFGDR